MWKHQTSVATRTVCAVLVGLWLAASAGCGQKGPLRLSAPASPSASSAAPALSASPSASAASTPR